MMVAARGGRPAGVRFPRTSAPSRRAVPAARAQQQPDLATTRDQNAGRASRFMVDDLGCDMVSCPGLDPLALIYGVTVARFPPLCGEGTAREACRRGTAVPHLSTFYPATPSPQGPDGVLDKYDVSSVDDPLGENRDGATQLTGRHCKSDRPSIIAYTFAGDLFAV